MRVWIASAPSALATFATSSCCSEAEVRAVVERDGIEEESDGMTAMEMHRARVREEVARATFHER